MMHEFRLGNDYVQVRPALEECFHRRPQHRSQEDSYYRSPQSFMNERPQEDDFVNFERKTQQTHWGGDFFPESSHSHNDQQLARKQTGSAAADSDAAKMAILNPSKRIRIYKSRLMKENEQRLAKAQNPEPRHRQFSTGSSSTQILGFDPRSQEHGEYHNPAQFDTESNEEVLEAKESQPAIVSSDTGKDPTDVHGKLDDQDSTAEQPLNDKAIRDGSENAWQDLLSKSGQPLKIEPDKMPVEYLNPTRPLPSEVARIDASRETQTTERSAAGENQKPIAPPQALYSSAISRRPSDRNPDIHDGGFDTGKYRPRDGSAQGDEKPTSSQMQAIPKATPSTASDNSKGREGQNTGGSFSGGLRAPARATDPWTLPKGEQVWGKYNKRK